MKQTYNWDKRKAQINLAKHKVSFEEGETIFDDKFSLTLYDPFHSEIEERFIDIGRSIKGNILVVVYTQCGEETRIISCRRAMPAERKAYEKQNS